MRDLTRRHEDAKDEEKIAAVTVQAALEIHSELGPGLLESVYEVVLADELERRGLSVQRQVDVPVSFRGRSFAVGFRADLVVEGKVCLELKSVESLSPLHAKQLLTYLRLLDYRLGILINFGAALLKDGLKRVVHQHARARYSSLASSRLRVNPNR